MWDVASNCGPTTFACVSSALPESMEEGRRVVGDVTAYLVIQNWIVSHQLYPARCGSKAVLGSCLSKESFFVDVSGETLITGSSHYLSSFPSNLLPFSVTSFSSSLSSAARPSVFTLAPRFSLFTRPSMSWVLNMTLTLMACKVNNNFIFPKNDVARRFMLLFGLQTTYSILKTYSEGSFPGNSWHIFNSDLRGSVLLISRWVLSAQEGARQKLKRCIKPSGNKFSEYIF